MKRKLLLGFMLSSLLSANSFAIEIHGGKLISHKEWTTGKVVSSSFKDIKPTINTSKLSLLRNGSPGGRIFVNSTTIPLTSLSIPTNLDVPFSGYSQDFIFNDSAVQKTYTITTGMNVTLPCSGQICANLESTAQDVVTLDPAGFGEIGRRISTTVNFASSGIAYYNVNTAVQANDGSPIFATMGDYLAIPVTDSQNSK